MTTFEDEQYAKLEELADDASELKVGVELILSKHRLDHKCYQPGSRCSTAGKLQEAVNHASNSEDCIRFLL